MKPGLFSAGRPPAERITDFYIITMLLIFPLFFGFSGYQRITLAKYAFFLGCTGLWAGTLAVTLLRRRASLHFGPVQWAALAYLLLCLLSWLCSPYRAQSLLGAGRYDGLLSSVGYVLIFLGVSSFARPKALHAQCFALAVSLCAAVALLQLAGRNPLGLYPAGLSYYDRGLKYSGAFLGTIGNTNLLDALLCMALPLFAGLYVCGSGAWCLPPLLLSQPVVWKAGGDGCKLALALTLLAALPLLLDRSERIRRALRCGGYILLVSALNCCWQPAAGAGLNFSRAPAALWLWLAGLASLGLSLLPAARRQPSPAALRRGFLALSLLLGLAGLAAAWFSGPGAGARYELGQLLRGHVEDRFGSSRIQIWRACLALLAARPLLGAGPGTAALRLDIHFSRYVPETGLTLHSTVDNCHNVYLGVAVNSGCLALAALLVLGCLVVRRCRQNRAGALTLPLGLGALCCAIQEFFGLGLCITMPLLWIILGLICAPREVTYENDLE